MTRGNSDELAETCDYCDREVFWSREWDGDGWVRVCDRPSCRRAFADDHKANVDAKNKVQYESPEGCILAGILLGGLLTRG